MHLEFKFVVNIGKYTKCHNIKLDTFKFAGVCLF